MSTEVEESIEFRCPKCAGDYFGSSGGFDGQPIHYYCRGREDGRRCDFTWTEKDAWKSS